ncbi:hypothetical protein BCV72DRAFT_260481 [Rhizopus microsporus var. microsporus]|uniref:Uncharacterized protein n=2 Tax=Rhizopus microsporus TaxID=58291 RepID=A0A2G4T8I3_RHIZD|nr:uncharacterized protein RHIMIDRAFT_310075 [Rhizopus microsporus ATCC 52813]ORE09845.1 hypothetical protein BCV72DRAFT_260481 [Rhizopus microsporus var. microsporus]PHZ17325.1 hypothetical protein RHIMIDRAFT_310075 [Rhizopus microsporus ATCC 52813]
MNHRIIPEEFYYLRPSQDLRRLKKTDLEDILMNHDVPFGPLMRRVELYRLFKSNILSRRDEIVDAYYAVMDNQNPINDNSNEDDESDSDHSPGDESDYESDRDDDELREGIGANELARLQSGNSLSSESLHQLYEQRQDYPKKLTVKKMIMAIFNTCIFTSRKKIRAV